MKFWNSSITKMNCSFKNRIVANGATFEKILAFQIFNDLCISRKWKRLKILKINNKKEFLIIGIIPMPGFSVEKIEIFLPIAITTSIIQTRYLFNLSLIKLLHNFLKSFYTINFGFIEWDSTISYYKVSDGIKKTIGPFL